MITNIHIENFKSIENMDLPLGSLNILIGENGCGKTNILEAAAIGVAAAKDKLDNEYYFARGIRKTENRFMKSAFDVEKTKKDIVINFTIDNEMVEFKINENYKGRLECINKSKVEFLLDKIYNSNFLLYAPENTFLRKFEEEGVIEGLGFRGEGLFDELVRLQHLISSYKSELYTMEIEQKLNEQIKRKLEKEELITNRTQLKKDLEKRILRMRIIKLLNKDIEQLIYEINSSNIEIKKLQAQKSAFEQLPKIKTQLRELLDWFEDFEITGSNMERKLYIKDRFLPEKTLFDQRSANEGFLLLLFYFTLFISDETPAFFAIDNIDTGLNPKLGSRLIEILAQLAKEHNKQVIITTHNPAILDGLDLRDEAQRLFVVSRNRVGKTKIQRIEHTLMGENEIPMKLSEKFLSGFIGGLPKNF